MSGEDALLARVRKLLAKAEDPAVTPAEAEAYNTKAAELIATYGIDAALLAATRPTADKVGDRLITLDPPYARDKAALLWAIAVPLRCKGVLRTRWDRGAGRKTFTMHLFGFTADLDRTELVFTSLLVQAAHGLAARRVPSWENPAAYRRAWLAGFTTAVGTRLSAAEERARRQAEPAQAATGGPSVALVLADRTALVGRAVEAAYPKTRPGRTRRLSGSGHRDGYQAGQRADIGTTRLAQPRSRAISGSDDAGATGPSGADPGIAL